MLAKMDISHKILGSCLQLVELWSSLVLQFALPDLVSILLTVLLTLHKAQGSVRTWKAKNVFFFCVFRTNKIFYNVVAYHIEFFRKTIFVPSRSYLYEDIPTFSWCACFQFILLNSLKFMYVSNVFYQMCSNF